MGITGMKSIGHNASIIYRQDFQHAHHLSYHAVYGAPLSGDVVSHIAIVTRSTLTIVL